MKERIQTNIGAMQDELGDWYWKTSASGMTLRPAIEDALERHAAGRLLDAGAGDLLYQPVVEPYVDSYESLDVIDNDALDYQQDLQDMDLDSGQFDTVFCRNVLEHVPRPSDSVAEIQRVLEPGGTTIITVPHLAYLHNEPYDYYRFTEHALREFCERADLEVVDIDPVGGLFSFLGYATATLGLGLTYHLPIISRVALLANYMVQRTVVTADRLTENESYFPLNYLLVARKPE